jgi:hypothetical protein
MDDQQQMEQHQQPQQYPPQQPLAAEPAVGMDAEETEAAAQNAIFQEMAIHPPDFADIQGFAGGLEFYRG